MQVKVQSRCSLLLRCYGKLLCRGGAFNGLRFALLVMAVTFLLTPSLSLADDEVNTLFGMPLPENTALIAVDAGDGSFIVYAVDTDAAWSDPIDPETWPATLIAFQRSRTCRSAYGHPMNSSWIKWLRR